MLKSFALLVIALAVAPTGAHAATAAPVAFWGGGGLPDRAPKANQAAYTDSFGVGLAKSADGRRISIRVAFAVKKCGRHLMSSADALVDADLAADGTFHLKGAPARTDEFGKVEVTIDGTAVAGRADGTLSVRTPYGCGLSTRAWSARQIDPKAPAAGAPPAPVDGVLYGITLQDLKGAPHPFVAKVEDGGTVAHGFLSWEQHCNSRDRKGPYKVTVGWQTVLPEVKIANGAWGRSTVDDETRAQRRKGIRTHNVYKVELAFDGSALRGTLTNRYTYRDGADRGTCTTRGTQGIVAVPA